MPKFRKKPVVIEAFQFDTGPLARGEATLPPMVRAELVTNSPCGRDDGHPTGRYLIDTLEGPHVVAHGDYIIRGVKGEFYPCKPDIFEMTYESAED